MTLYVNLFAGPGCGKSTMATSIFSKIKKKSKFTCEYVSEYAKELTWKRDYVSLSDQYLVTGNQHNREYILNGKVDVVITDSPLLLGLAYYNDDNKKIKKLFTQLVYELFNQKNNLNFFIKRSKKYDPIGRNQTEDEAHNIDKFIKNLLVDGNIPFDIINNTDENFVIKSIKERVQ